MKNIYLIIAYSFLLMSCATSYKVQSTFEDNIYSSNYKTYAIMRHDGEIPVTLNPINKERIADAVNIEVLKAGYSYSENPDLVVAWYITKQETRSPQYVSQYYDEWSFFPLVNGSTYEEGVIVLDIIDWKSKRVFWHGTTHSPVFLDIKNARKKVTKVIESIFEQYDKDKQ